MPTSPSVFIPTQASSQSHEKSLGLIAGTGRLASSITEVQPTALRTIAQDSSLEFKNFSCLSTTDFNLIVCLKSAGEV